MNLLLDLSLGGAQPLLWGKQQKLLLVTTAIQQFKVTKSFLILNVRLYYNSVQLKVEAVHAGSMWLVFKVYLPLCC